MRDIKLRWFVEDDFVYTDRLSDLDFDCFINVENGEICLFCESGDDDFIGIKYEKADNRTREQFTGIKDINGVDIYEGDIVRDHIGIGIVEYSEKKAAFKVNYLDGFAKWFIDYILTGERESIEVIGNIHQHPELLEK